MKDILSHFQTIGTISDVKPMGNGLINDTYKVETKEATAPDYVLQRINHHVFQRVDILQHNIEQVTTHLYNKLKALHDSDLNRKVLRFIPTDEGKTFWFDGNSYWRVSVFIPEAYSFENVTAPYAYCAGQAFGKFEADLVDLPTQLDETIPNFHNMEFRLQQFHDAIATDRVHRVAEVQDLLSELEKRSDEMCKAEQLYREGVLPKRICHCDTKVNNMLFDKDGNVLCVIDLDTVMPSFVFSDIGDFLRTSANTGAEDDPNLENVGFNMDIFRAFVGGYLESTKDVLLPVEVENIPYAAALFPYMQAVRFLTDYIQGDTYYKISYPTHNLVRARAQFKLLQSVEKHALEMAEFVHACLHMSPHFDFPILADKK